MNFLPIIINSILMLCIDFLVLDFSIWKYASIQILVLLIICNCLFNVYEIEEKIEER